MNIRLTPETALRLETTAVQSRGYEFSGFGFAEIQGEELIVYDFILCHIGSEAYTEIDTSIMAKLVDREDARALKVWVHRHPLGDGKPGKHNWSGTDESTIQHTPLGGIPELVRWSASIVRTPGGWVGRIDNHITKKTQHVPVLGQAPEQVYQEIEALHAYRREWDAIRTYKGRPAMLVLDDPIWSKLKYVEDDAMQRVLAEGDLKQYVSALKKLKINPKHLEKIGCPPQDLLDLGIDPNFIRYWLDQYSVDVRSLDPQTIDLMIQDIWDIQVLAESGELMDENGYDLVVDDLHPGPGLRASHTYEQSAFRFGNLKFDDDEEDYGPYTSHRYL